MVNSATNRYEISLPGHITWLRNQSRNTKVYCEQVNNINLSGYSIGDNYSRQIDYDGQDFEIQNLTYTPGQNGNHRKSFFATLNNSALQNMRFTNLQHSSGQEAAGICTFFNSSLMFNVHIISGSIIGEIRSAGFVSKMTSSTIYNCSLNATVKDRCQGVGGLVYQLIDSDINQCYVKGLIRNRPKELCNTAKNNNGKGTGIGGIAYIMDGNSSISNSYCHAELENWTNSTDKVRAGIVAVTSTGAVVENCYFAGQLSGTGALNQPILPTINPISTCVYTLTDSAAGSSYIWQSNNLINSFGISYTGMASSNNYPTNWLVDGGWSLDPLVNNGLPYQSGIAQVSSSTISSLTIPSGQVYEVFPGVAIDASTLNNDGTIILRANTNGDYAQLRFISLGTTNNSVQQFQYLETGSHAIASPFTSGFTTTSGDNTKLYSYDATAGAWNAMGTNLSTPGIGYFARVDPTQIPFVTSAATASISGTPNTSNTWNIGYSSVFASGASSGGWNLIGNPYTCGLDWSTISNSNINTAIYIWDPGSSTYKYSTSIGGGTLTGVVPPMQAFWVQSTAATTISTSMVANGTVASTPTYYKTQPDQLELSVTLLSDSSIIDKLWVAHVPAAQDGFDGAFDAWKMTNGPTMPNVYTCDASEHLAVNATNVGFQTVLPMGFDYSVPGSKFRVELIKRTQGDSYQVFLEDKQTGSFYNIGESSYTFKHESWSQEAPRFALHINRGSIGVETDIVNETSFVYQDGSDLIIKRASGESSSYQIFNLTGQEISSGVITEFIQRIESPPISGMYIIQWMSGTGIQRHKIQFIK